MLYLKKRHIGRENTSRIRILFLFLVPLITSCAHEPIEKYVAGRAKPQLEMNPAMEVLEFTPKLVSAVADSQEQVHMLAADEKSGVVYLIIGRTGVKHRETVAPTWKQGALQIAIDAEGIVHAIVGDEHFIRQNNQWRAVEQVLCQRLIRAGGGRWRAHLS